MRDLAHRLRLARELGQVVPIANRPLAEAQTRMRDALVRTDERHSLGRDVRRHGEPRPATRHRVVGALDAHERS